MKMYVIFVLIGFLVSCSSKMSSSQKLEANGPHGGKCFKENNLIVEILTGENLKFYFFDQEKGNFRSVDTAKLNLDQGSVDPGSSKSIWSLQFVGDKDHYLGITPYKKLRDELRYRLDFNLHYEGREYKFHANIESSKL